LVVTLGSTLRRNDRGMLELETGDDHRQKRGGTYRTQKKKLKGNRKERLKGGLNRLQNSGRKERTSKKKKKQIIEKKD